MTESYIDQVNNLSMIVKAIFCPEKDIKLRVRLRIFKA